VTHSARPTRPRRPRIPRAPLAVVTLAVATAALLAALFVVNADPPSSPTGTPALVVPESPNAPSVGVQPVTPLPDPVNDTDGPLDGQSWTYRVGEQMTPGTWVTDGAAEPGEACTWRRMRGVEQDTRTVVKEGSSSGRAEVIVKNGDEFVTIGCNPWRMA